MKKYKTTILSMGVLLYIFFNIVNFFLDKTIKIQALEYSTLENKVRKQGVVIRIENIIKSNLQGSIDYKIEESERVKKGQVVANIYNDKNYKEIVGKIKKVDEEIKNIKEKSIVTKDIQKLEGDIEVVLNDIKQNVDVEKNKKKLEKLISKKSELKQKEDINKALLNKQTEKENLEDKLNKYCFNIESKNSGIALFDIDGYEDIFKYENMMNLTINDLKNANNNKQSIGEKSNIKKNEKIVKIVDNHKIYIAANLKDSESYNLDLNKKIKLKFDEKEVQSKVYFKKKENTDENLVIFEINEQIKEFFDTRVLEFDIIYNKVEGLKIPKKSVIENGDVKGVYIISKTGKTEFKELKGISGEDEDFYVINYYKNQREGIDTVDVNDEIMINPKHVK